MVTVYLAAVLPLHDIGTDKRGGANGARNRERKTLKESARILCAALVLEGVAYLQERDGIVRRTNLKREVKKRAS